MRLLLFVNIGFLDISFKDIIDILVVGLLIYQVYKLLKGNLAFNILVGVGLVYTLAWVVQAMEMSLLSKVLGEFVDLGVVMLLIVFQPEVRRFLLFLGRTTLQRRTSMLQRLFAKNKSFDSQTIEQCLAEILQAVDRMKKAKTGALIVFASNPHTQALTESGCQLDAAISARLIQTIFQKDTPLHDGAMLIYKEKIAAAACILPISDSTDLPQSCGLRHRAGVGVTENSDALAVIVSEETGRVSTAQNGILRRDLSQDELYHLLKKNYEKFYE